MSQLGWVVLLIVVPWVLTFSGMGSWLADRRGRRARFGLGWGLAGPAGWWVIWRATRSDPAAGAADGAAGGSDEPGPWDDTSWLDD